MFADVHWRYGSVYYCNAFPFCSFLFRCAFHFLEQLCKVCANSLCVGMVRAKRLLPDGESALVEGQGLLVLALAVVESCQVVEAAGGIGMVGIWLGGLLHRHWYTVESLFYLRAPKFMN
jgi:hypothetical protein